MLLVTLARAAIKREPTHAHFTIEFVPFFPAGTPQPRCEPAEVDIINLHVTEIIKKDTGFKNPTKQQYLPELYNKGLHPSFDYTYECPEKCEEDDDWCGMICKGAHHHNFKAGHDFIDGLGIDLKETVHHSSKGLDGPYSVKCLGVGAKLDVHLRVSTSPYMPNTHYNAPQNDEL